MYASTSICKFFRRLTTGHHWSVTCGELWGWYAYIYIYAYMHICIYASSVTSFQDNMQAAPIWQQVHIGPTQPNPVPREQSQSRSLSIWLKKRYILKRSIIEPPLKLQSICGDQLPIKSNIQAGEYEYVRDFGEYVLKWNSRVFNMCSNVLNMCSNVFKMCSICAQCAQYVLNMCSICAQMCSICVQYVLEWNSPFVKRLWLCTLGSVYSPLALYWYSTKSLVSKYNLFREQTFLRLKWKYKKLLRKILWTECSHISILAISIYMDIWPYCRF